MLTRKNEWWCMFEQCFCCLQHIWTKHTIIYGKLVTLIRKAKGSVQAAVIHKDTNIIHKSIRIDLGKWEICLQVRNIILIYMYLFKMFHARFLGEHNPILIKMCVVLVITIPHTHTHTPPIKSFLLFSYIFSLQIESSGNLCMVPIW